MQRRRTPGGVTADGRTGSFAAVTLSAEDTVAIQQLAAAYCHHVDDGNGEGVAALFTDDGELEIVDLTHSIGSEQIAENSALFPQVFPGGRHIVQNVWIEGDGDHATMRAYLSNVVTGEQPTQLQTGRYRDELVRTSDGWRFTKRHLTLDGPLF